MIGFFEHQFVKFKKNHLRNLVALARIDGHLHDDEVKFLYKIGEKYKLKNWQIKSILEKENDAEILIPEDYKQKVGQLYELVGMMMADGVIDDREMEFCNLMVGKYGLKPGIIQKMIGYYQNGEEEFKDWNTFLEESRKYIES